MSPALTRRGFVQGGAAVLGAAVAGIPATVRAATVALPAVFDAEAFVDDLLDAGCDLSVHHPVGPGAGPAYVWIAPAGLDGAPTTGEREVRARWAMAMAACHDADARVLAVCRVRAERHREERARRLGEVVT